MKKALISIIYAHRNRDTKRVLFSLESLKKQHLQNFEVIFVDYGSKNELVEALKNIARDFSFVHFYHLPVPQLLWNKSKALNYGIKKTQGEFVFIADIDLIFHSEATQLFQQIAASDKYFLFKLGYLEKKESMKLQAEYSFNELQPARYGEVNGMIFTSRESLMEVKGLDEFFHFYGAEDEDLFSRLETAGYQRMHRADLYFNHQWHQSFTGSEDILLTGNPRMKNIMRINQRHYERNRERRIIKPLKQGEMGTFVSEERSAQLQSPTSEYRIPNIQAYVEHFLKEELPSLTGEVIQVVFYQDVFYKSMKYQVKGSLRKQTQSYISMKEVNDLILKEILYNYRDHNYSYLVENDIKNIVFSLEI